MTCCLTQADEKSNKTIRYEGKPVVRGTFGITSQTFGCVAKNRIVSKIILQHPAKSQMPENLGRLLDNSV